MGIESDQLVYDYLSRVGDVAQQSQLPSGARMRLVSALRNEIDRQRGTSGGDSPAAVRRIIGRMGTPDAVVQAASGRAGADESAPYSPPPLPGPVLPEQRSGRAGSWRGKEPEAADAPGIPRQSPGASRPDAHDPPGIGPDWWRIGQDRDGTGTGVSGFIGGVEIPELLAPRSPERAAGAAQEGGTEQAAPVKAAVNRRWRRRRTDGEEAGTGKPAKRAGGPTHPFLLLAAALLVAGAILGSWPALAGGWLLAYASRKLSRTEAKWAVFGLPGVSLAGGLVWLWGRSTGRWGAPIPEDRMGDALSDVWPVVIRVAAITSALYLAWRARRR